ncbi:putative G-protein coupled receptor 150 [Lissotriton helveticus]
MEDVFGSESFLSSSSNFSFPGDGYHRTVQLHLNFSSSLFNSSGRDSNAERVTNYNRPLRILSMALILAAALLGNCLVLLHTCPRAGRPKRRKIDFTVRQLALADLYVSVVTLLSQLVWELLDDEWLAGDLACRLFKVLQVSGLMASSNMVAVMALERHRVVLMPLGAPLPARALAAGGWLLALLLSVPQAFVFQVRGRRCLSTLRRPPDWHFQAYIMYGACTVFLAPFCILCVSYSRILWVIWRKGGAGGRAPGQEPRLTAANSAIPRARVRTLKMTLVIIALFVLCGLPYFVVELKLAIGRCTGLDERVMAVLGIFVVTNSAVNPYVYLCFRTGGLGRLERSLCPRGCCALREPQAAERPLCRCHRQEEAQYLPGASSSTYRKEPSSTSTTDLDTASVSFFMGRPVTFKKPQEASSGTSCDCSL